MYEVVVVHSSCVKQFNALVDDGGKAAATAMSAYMVESVETNKGLLFMYSTAPSAARRIAAKLV